MLTRITDQKTLCVYIHFDQITKNWGPGLYNSLYHTDSRYFSGPSLTRNRREVHMFYLAREVGKSGYVLAEKKGNFVMINEFKYDKPKKFDHLHLVYHFTVPLWSFMQQILKEAFSQNHSTLCWILTSTHKHHIISIKYPSHKCLPEKSCPYCLRILIISWLFKDPVVIMKEIMPWLFKDPIVTVAWINFDHAQLNSKNNLKGSNCPKWDFFSKNN